MVVEPVETTTEVELTRRRFTVDEYTRLVAAGILAEDDAVELMWGEIVEMSPINVSHALCVNRLNMLLSAKLGGRAIVSIQNPIQLDEYSLPQPDVALWDVGMGANQNRFPGPTEVLLVVEVADTSIHHDRRAKTRLYGGAGIADYWIVNISARQIEVYREPRLNGYRTVTHYAPGEILSPLSFADVVLNVDEILVTNA